MMMILVEIIMQRNVYCVLCITQIISCNTILYILLHHYPIKT